MEINLRRLIMKKKLSLTISILNIISTICYFVPFCLNRDFWEYDNSYVYHGIATFKSHEAINIFDVGGIFGKPFAIFLLCSTIFCVVVYFFKALENTSKICNHSWGISIIHSMILFAFLAYSCEYAAIVEVSAKFTYSINWMFYIIILLFVVSLLLSTYIKFGKSNNFLKKETEKDDDVEVLLEYKKLLDLGIITQQDFDEKKKDILKF